MKSRGRAFQHLRAVAIEPEQLGRLLASRQPAASKSKRGACRPTLTEDFDQRGCPRIQPQYGRSDGCAISIDKPGAVALTGDRKRDNFLATEPLGQLA
jgi:hypothetical protein